MSLPYVPRKRLDFGVITNEDLKPGGAESLAGCRTLVLSVRPEYWTRTMLDLLELSVHLATPIAPAAARGSPPGWFARHGAELTHYRTSHLTHMITMMNSDVPERTLNDGNTLPVLGFGTYTLNGEGAVEVICSAIEQGYRLLDSAFDYENEGALGEAVRQAGVAREELRLTSKLPGRHHSYGEAINTVHESLYRAGLDYYDLYLIHWPNPSQGKYVDAWRALVELQRQGVVRSIGVSNFLQTHLQNIIHETGVTPSVNQIEMHPYFPQVEQREFDSNLGIVTEAWTPLGRTTPLLAEPAVAAVATAHDKTVAQTILRWHVQLGAVPLPKSSSRERQRENLELFNFQLTDAEMNAITALGRPDGRTFAEDPAVHEEY